MQYEKGQQLPFRHKHLARCKVTANGDGTARIEGSCFVTHKPYVLERVPIKAIQEWENGAYAQDAFKYILTPDETEFLISGTSPDGWALIFPPE